MIKKRRSEIEHDNEFIFKRLKVFDKMIFFVWKKGDAFIIEVYEIV